MIGYKNTISGGSSIMQPIRIPENTRNVILVMNLIMNAQEDYFIPARMSLTRSVLPFVTHGGNELQGSCVPFVCRRYTKSHQTVKPYRMLPYKEMVSILGMVILWRVWEIFVTRAIC